MTARDEFSKELQAGRYQHALAAALKDAIELQVITWVSSGDGYDWSAGSDRPLPGQRMQTRINIVEGDIENEIGREFLDGPYQELRPFHEDQVERGFDIIHENLRTVQELFKVLMHFRQGKRPLSGAPEAGTMELASVNLDESAAPLDAPVDDSIPAIASASPDDAMWTEDSDWDVAMADVPAAGTFPTDETMTTATRTAMTESGMMGTDDLAVDDLLYQPESMETPSIPSAISPPSGGSAAPDAALDELDDDMDLEDLMYDGTSDQSIESAAPPMTDPVPALGDDEELSELAFEAEDEPFPLGEAAALFEGSSAPPPLPGDDLDVSELIYDDHPAATAEPAAIASDEQPFDPSTVLDADPELADLSFHADGAAAIAPDDAPEPPPESSAVTDVTIPDELTQQLQAAAAQAQQEPVVLTDVSEELHLLELDLLNVETEADLEMMVEPGNLATNLRSLAETTPLNPRPNPLDAIEGGEEALGESIAPTSETEPDPLLNRDYDELQSDSNLDDFDFASDDSELNDVIQSMASDADEPPRHQASSDAPAVPDAIADDILTDLPDLSDESDPPEAIEMSEEELSDLFAEGSGAAESADWAIEDDIEEDEFPSTELTDDALQDFEAFLGEAEAELMADVSMDTPSTDASATDTGDELSDLEDLLFFDEGDTASELADPNDPFQTIAPENSDAAADTDTSQDDPLGLFSDADALDALDAELSSPAGDAADQDDPLELLTDDSLASDVATLGDIDASSIEGQELEEMLDESRDELDPERSPQSMDDEDLMDLADLLMENMPDSSQDERDRSLLNTDVPDPWEELN